MVEHERFIAADRCRLPGGRSFGAARIVRSLPCTRVPADCKDGWRPRSERFDSTGVSPRLSHDPPIYGSIRFRDLALSIGRQRVPAVSSLYKAPFARNTGARTCKPMCGSESKRPSARVAGVGTTATRPRAASSLFTSRSRRTWLRAVSVGLGDIRRNCGFAPQSSAVQAEGVSP